MSFYKTPDGRIVVEKADCLDWMGAQADNSIAGIVTDPPYGLSDPPDALQMLKAWLEFEEHEQGGAGFMGAKWDAFVKGPRYWREALRITKPGGFAFVFGGCRTYDLTVLAMRIAGWEIRTCIMWVFSSSMLHGINVSKAIDKAAGVEREVVGIDEAWLKRNPDTGASERGIINKGHKDGIAGAQITAPATPLAKRFEGYQSKMAAGYEPIVVAMVPLEGTFAANAEKWGVAGLNLGECKIGDEVITTHGGGGKCGTVLQWSQSERVAQNTQHTGRAAKNLLHDNSPEVLEVFARAKIHSAGHKRAGKLAMLRDMSIGESSRPKRKRHSLHRFGDVGTADRFYQACPWSPEDKAEFARFRYQAKASKRERGRGNNHQTVKPIDLMRWLCRLDKQPGDQLYCDPFGGSGTTGLAAIREGMRFVVVEKLLHNCEIIKSRLECEPPRLPFIDEEDEPPPEPTMQQIELF